MQCIGETPGVWRLGSLWRSLIHWIFNFSSWVFRYCHGTGQNLFLKRKIRFHQSEIFKAIYNLRSPSSVHDMYSALSTAPHARTSMRCGGVRRHKT